MQTLHWLHDDQSILVATYTGAWTWADHFATVKKVTQMLNTVRRRVDLIVDVSQSAPPLGASVANISLGRQPKGANFGIVVFVGVQGFHTALLGMIPKVYRSLASQIVYADSLDDACDRIYQRRLDDDTESDY